MDAAVLENLLRNGYVNEDCSPTRCYKALYLLYSVYNLSLNAVPQAGKQNQMNTTGIQEPSQV